MPPFLIILVSNSQCKRKNDLATMTKYIIFYKCKRKNDLDKAHMISISVQEKKYIIFYKCNITGYNDKALRCVLYFPNLKMIWTS